MKGVELPINILVVVAIAVIVLLGMVALYLIGFNPISVTTAQDAANMSHYVIFSREMISGLIAVILSVVFAYVPKLRVWFAGLESRTKSYIMLGLLVVTSVTVYLLADYGIILTYQPVTIFTLFQVILTAIATNQGTYMILPQTTDVAEARDMR